MDLIENGDFDGLVQAYQNGEFEHSSVMLEKALFDRQYDIARFILLSGVVCVNHIVDTMPDDLKEIHQNNLDRYIDNIDTRYITLEMTIKIEGTHFVERFTMANYISYSSLIDKLGNVNINKCRDGWMRQDFEERLAETHAGRYYIYEWERRAIYDEIPCIDYEFFDAIKRLQVKAPKNIPTKFYLYKLRKIKM